jgi:hypothetical protein
MALRTTGTGAIDLAAGSSGVNISNGGTVTAITRTAVGSAYTTPPTVAISAPTTAGGVQATATCTLGLGLVVSGGGTGYTVGDTLTVVGGTRTVAATCTVTTVSSGVITLVTVTAAGYYTATPTSPASVTGGTGTGATLTVSSFINAAFTITNAGSGYIEQPTITFSGGGGSGAAAYATVGSGTVVKGIGASTISGITNASIVFQTPNTVAPNFLMRETAGADSFLMSAPNSGYAQLIAQGNATAILKLGCNGAGRIELNTNGTGETNQMRIAHTASAVNYVQVTGSATATQPVISAQGSDASVGLRLQWKGQANMFFTSGAGAYTQFRLLGANNAVNNLAVTGTVAGSAPFLSAEGTDTDIDLALTPKGAGLIRFGTYVAGATLATGYINIKAADGTTYKVLVST